MLPAIGRADAAIQRPFPSIPDAPKARSMAVYFHEEDLPADVVLEGPVAVDTETMGLITPRDRLCVVQISDGGGDEHLVRFNPDSEYEFPSIEQDDFRSLVKAMVQLPQYRRIR